MKEEYEQSKLIKHGGKEPMTHLTGKHSVKTKAIEKKKGVGYKYGGKKYSYPIPEGYEEKSDAHGKFLGKKK